MNDNKQTNEAVISTEELNNIMLLDERNVDNERRKLELVKPTEFPKGDIDNKTLESLAPLLSLDFPKEALKKVNLEYSAQYIDANLMINRAKYVLGLTHIELECSMSDEIGEEVKLNKHKEEYIEYRVKGKGTLRIGNRVTWTDAITGEIHSKFISICETSDIGSGKSTSRDKVEKNCRTDLYKRCLRNIGVTKYIYCEDEVSTKQSFKVILAEQPKINPNYKFNKIKVGFRGDNGDIEYGDLVLFKNTKKEIVEKLSKLNHKDSIIIFADKGDYQGDTQFKNIVSVKKIEE